MFSAFLAGVATAFLHGVFSVHKFRLVGAWMDFPFLLPERVQSMRAKNRQDQQQFRLLPIIGMPTNFIIDEIYSNRVNQAALD